MNKQTDFDAWCRQGLSAFGAHPAILGYCLKLDSEKDVYDHLLQSLGSSKEAVAFTKEYLRGWRSIKAASGQLSPSQQGKRGFYDEFDTSRKQACSAPFDDKKGINQTEPEKLLLASDGTAGYGGFEYFEGESLTMEGAPEDDKYKWDYLWSGLDEGVRCNLKMDPIARFSVTDMKTADKMSEVILGLEGISSDSVITDATACVGGNTVSFAKHFKTVQAIELDESRYHQLKHNLDLITTAYGGNYFLGELKQDVVFVDPPWGGSAYKEQCGTELYLSGVAISQAWKVFKICSLKVAADTGRKPSCREISERACALFKPRENVDGSVAIQEHALLRAAANVGIVWTIQAEVAFASIFSSNKAEASG